MLNCFSLHMSIIRWLEMKKEKKDNAPDKRQLPCLGKKVNVKNNWSVWVKSENCRLCQSISDFCGSLPSTLYVDTDNNKQISETKIETKSCAIL